MNIRSLKFRLIAWYTGWLTLLFVVFGLFVYQSLDHYLRESLREALARRARQVADTAQRLPRTRAGWPWKSKIILLPKSITGLPVSPLAVRLLTNPVLPRTSASPLERFPLSSILLTEKPSRVEFLQTEKACWWCRSSG